MNTLVCIVILAVLTLASSHSWMTQPRTYCKSYGLNDCRNGECNLPCPLECSGQNNSVDSPEARYQRGQDVEIRWVLNRHHNGFFRIGFVPVREMWNREAHEKFALSYGCWDENEFPCDSSYNCGTANNNRAGGTTISVPSCLPDGSYVLSYAWAGGTKTPTRKGGIPDYHHCSFVEIAGGIPVSGTCMAEFTPSKNGPVSVGGGTCETSARDFGDCKVTGCNGPNLLFRARPAPFENGNRPAGFTAEDISRFQDGSGDLDNQSTLPGAQPSHMPTLETPSPSSYAQPTMLPTPSSFYIPGKRRALCGGGVCCSPTCKRCAARNGCHKYKTLGSDLCCRNSVLRTKRSCDTHEPPCICNRERPKECPKYF